MKNKLTDLNDYLFAQLERLADEQLAGDSLTTEIARTEAVVQLADTIVDNARLQLDGCKFAADHGERGGTTIGKQFGILALPPAKPKESAA